MIDKQLRDLRLSELGFGIALALSLYAGAVDSLLAAGLGGFLLGFVLGINYHAK